MENEHAQSAPAYIDPRSGRTYSLSEPRWRSDEGLPLMITLLPGIGRGEIHSGTRSLWRYASSFPVPVANPVSMGEGCTPLVDHPWRGGRVHFKLEWFAPTGSFKDRGASVMISILRQQGVTRLLEDSSGNGGAAIAAYAAAGGIKAKILVPATTRPGKTVQMRAYGAEVELIPGTRQDTADEAQRQAERISTPAIIGRPSSSRGRRRWLTSYGKTSGSGRPTTSSYPPARAATSSAAISVSANSCDAERSTCFLGSSQSSPRTALPSARASPRALQTTCP